MAKAVYIQSYAQAERLGIKPFDSIISKVVIPGKKPKIVAMQGHGTTSSKDRGKYTMGKLEQYADAHGYRYWATSTTTLNILLHALFTRRPKVFKVVMRRV